MRVDEQLVLSVADSFADAAFTGNWLSALSVLARVTCSQAGQMIGVGSENSVPFNLVTEFGKNYASDFVEMGGCDPSINPFIRVGMSAPPLQAVSSADFMTRHDHLHNLFLVEHARRYDSAYVCLMNLIKIPDLVIGLSVVQSSKQGPLNAQNKAVFSSIAPHVRAAVRTQIAMEHQGAALMAGTLEALSLTAFICDRQGMVRAMTPSAELLASAGSLLKIKNGLLHSVRPLETRVLTNAIMHATGGLTKVGMPVSSTILIRDQLAQPLVLEVLVLPRRDFTFGFEPRALVIVRGSQPNANGVQLLLCTAYGLTTAEVDVAVRLVEGQSPGMIAAERNASIGTVRVQIRSIYEKLGVNRFSEFATKVNQLR
jgi:DNA-binding CsgD family transcriptional regulator